MSEKIWAYHDRFDGCVWTTGEKPTHGSVETEPVEYIPLRVLPDEMEDGHELAEAGGVRWVVEIWDGSFTVTLDTGNSRLAMSPQEAAILGAPDLSNYEVQGNKIRRKG